MHPNDRSVPVVLKISFTAFMAILVPAYWSAYGPTNFLYFCDVALFAVLVAVWTDSALLVSAAAVGILVPQALWVLDFGLRLVGAAPTGMTAYMFDQNLELFYRGLSLFHGWLPFLLIYLVYRLGYDKRAIWLWTVTAEALLLICYWFMPAPSGAERVVGQVNPPVNINYVHGLSDAAPQTMMSPTLWIALLMIALPLLVYLPTHVMLNRWRGKIATETTPEISSIHE